MEIIYDKVADALSIRLSRAVIVDSDEIKDGLIIDYGDHGEVVGIELLGFSHRQINLNTLILMNSDELVPSLIKCM